VGLLKYIYWRISNLQYVLHLIMYIFLNQKKKMDVKSFQMVEIKQKELKKIDGVFKPIAVKRKYKHNGSKIVILAESQKKQKERTVALLYIYIYI
jgi:hypothetical protein